MSSFYSFNFPGAFGTVSSFKGRRIFFIAVSRSDVPIPHFHLQWFNTNSLIIIIMVIFKCYFSGELIALSYIKKNNNNSGVNIELERKKKD